VANSANDFKKIIFSAAHEIKIVEIYFSPVMQKQQQEQ
jgi:hypothetical protein